MTWEPVDWHGRKASYQRNEVSRSGKISRQNDEVIKFQGNVIL